MTYKRRAASSVEPDYLTTQHEPVYSGSLGALQSYLGFYLRLSYRAVVPAVVERLSSLDLTLAEFGVLVVVDANPDAGLGDIANLLQIDKGNFATLINEMRRRDLVRRVVSRHDGRRHHLTLTVRGLRKLKRAITDQDALENSLKHLLGGTNHKNLMRLLRLVVDRSLLPRH